MREHSNMVGRLQIKFVMQSKVLHCGLNERLRQSEISMNIRSGKLIEANMRLKILVVVLLAASTAFLSMQKAVAQNAAVGETSGRARTTTSRRVFVRSNSLLVRGAVVEDKLLRRPEFRQLGFVITRDAADADIILELRHDLLTKYIFSVVDVRTQTVIAGGKLSSLGGTVAGKVAKRFVKEMARTPTS
jgi:cytochrome c-type biogenesis protein CcmE